jgi:streptogramin lyase
VRFARYLALATALWVVVLAGAATGAGAPAADLVGTRVALGPDQQGPVIGEGAVWVATRDGLSKVDPATGAIVRTTPLPLAGEPAALAAGEGALWVVDPRAGVLIRVDPATGAVVSAAIPVPGGSEVAAGLGAVWVLQRQARTVTRFDPATNASAPVVAVGAEAAAIAVGEGGVWVADQAGDSVTRLDPITGAVQAVIPVGEDPGQVVTGAGAVWVVNSSARSVSRISPATNTVVATIALDPDRSGQDLAGSIAVGAGAVWVDGGDREDPLRRIDPATNRVTGRFSPFAVTSGPVALAADATTLWSSQDGVLLRISPTPRVPPGRLVRVGGEPRSLAVGRAGVWLVDRRSGALRRLSRSTGRPVGRPIRIARPLSVVVADGLVAVLDARGAVVRVSERTGRVLSRTLVRGVPQSMALGAGAIWVVVQNGGLDGTLVAMDAATGRVRSRTRLGLGTGDVAVAGGRVWAIGEDLVAVDPRTARVVIRRRAGPFGLFTAAGPDLVVSGSDGVQLLNARTGRPRTRGIIVGSTLRRPARGPGGVLLFPDFAEGTIAPVTTRGGLNSPLPVLVGREPSAAVIVGREVWVALAAEGAVRRIPLSALGLGRLVPR